MKVRCVINIKKHNQILGNCFIDKKISTIEMLTITKNIIDNYNERLSNYRTDSNKLGLRILLQSDKYGFDKKAPAGLTKKSFEYLSKVLPTSRLEEATKDEYMYISAISSHNEPMLKCEEYYTDILIDFDFNIINCNLLGKVERDAYESYNSHSYNILEYDLQSLAINDLKDVIIFFNEQKEIGFLKKGRDQEVYIAFY
jgi:hypothetical protein